MNIPQRFYNSPTTLVDLFNIGMDRVVPEPLPMPAGLVLNLGAGSKLIADTVPLDLPLWDADVHPIPYASGKVDGIHAYHFLEHVKNPVALLQEIQRVLKPDGLVNIVVPYYNAHIAREDLDHKHFFNEDTWRILFRNVYYDKNRIEWKLDVHFNMIMALVERNLCLFTQLVKQG